MPAFRVVSKRALDMGLVQVVKELRTYEGACAYLEVIAPYHLKRGGLAIIDPQDMVRPAVRVDDSASGHVR